MYLLKSERGQVAVEFLIVFILMAVLILYIYIFDISLATIQKQNYVAFMVGRTITASASNYAKKGSNAQLVLDMYNSSPATLKNLTTGKLDCGLTPTNKGFRNILEYGSGVWYDVASTIGIACKMSTPYLLPVNSKNFKVATDLMMASEISDDHCKCVTVIGDSSKTRSWKACLDEKPKGVIFVDNGC